MSDIKRKVLTDLSGRYQEEKIQQFLGEVTAMDPRFKAKSVWYSTWEHLQEAAVAINAIEADVPIPESHEDSDTTEEAMYENPQVEVSPPSQPKAKSALEELFAEEEQERRTIRMNNSNSSIQQRVCDEIQLYRSLPMISMAEDPVLCSRWWTKRDTLPLLAELSHGYLIVQASSTPSEGVFPLLGTPSARSVRGSCLTRQTC